MDLQLSSVGTRKCTGSDVIRLVRRSVLVPRWSSQVCCFLLQSGSSLEENGKSVLFSCSGDYYLIRHPMLPPSQSQGVSRVELQKRTVTYWLQADQRVTVDDKSSANALAGFSSVMAPIQEGGAASSSDVAVAELLPNAAEAGRVSREAVPIEHGQMSEQ